jgi:CRP-like cAMP-binding protein
MVEVYLHKNFSRQPKSPDERGGKTVLQTQLEKQNKTSVERSRNNGEQIVFLSAMDFNLPAGGAMDLGPGEIFGEIGAMSGWPQSVTARAIADCVLVQIRVPALRRMKRKSPALKQRLDKIYRERALLAQLRTTPLFRPCDEIFLEALSQKVELVSFEPNEIIVKENEPVEAIYLVRSGFVKLSQKMGEGDLIVSYLSKGMTLGEAELLLEGMPGWNCTAAAVEFTDLVKISREDFLALTKKYSSLGKQLWRWRVSNRSVAAKKALAAHNLCRRRWKKVSCRATAFW